MMHCTHLKLGHALDNRDTLRKDPATWVHSRPEAIAPFAHSDISLELLNINHRFTMPAVSTVVPLHEKCQYPSKSCPQRRARKIDGELHRLCEFHRQVANRNQQRLQQRRRQLRLEQARCKLEQEMMIPLTFPEDEECGLGELALEDLEILLQLLGNSDDGVLAM